MTTPKQIAFIINPIAGRKKSGNIAEIIGKNLELAQWDPTFYYTENPGHGTNIVKEIIKEGITTIVAVGGDGTINEVASACVNKPVKLGVIPRGSGNGLARELKIPISPARAISCINKDFTSKIDVGYINGKSFFCTCGTGFDAKIGHKFAKNSKRGFLTYVKITILEYFKFKPKKLKIVIDDDKIKRKVFLITIANAKQYGNNAFIAPDAKLDDGYFDICILKPFPWYKSAFLGIRLFNGTINKSKYLEITRAKKIVLPKKKKFKFHIDGEPCVFKGPVTIEMQPLALNVISPER